MNQKLPLLTGKLLLAVMLVALLLLQYRLWLSPTGLSATDSLKQQLSHQVEKNKVQQQSNRQLQAEVESLKSGLDQIEARARSELGMIKPDETFFFIVEPEEGGRDTKQTN